MSALLELPNSTLVKLANAITREVVRPPFGPSNLAGFVGPAAVARVSQALEALLASGNSPTGVATTLQILATSRAASPEFGQLASFVASGPSPALQGRDTAVVVPELFRSATSDVLVVGFTAKRGADIFEPLQRQREAHPTLRVRLCLNIARDWKDDRPAAAILEEFRRELAAQIWPWAPLPEVFYDPRALLPFDGPRASLHGKAIVVDHSVALITSANFTEAAQERNIELGVLVREPSFAATVEGHIESLIASSDLVRL